MADTRRVVVWSLTGVIVLLVVIQAIPYGRNHANPPVDGEPPWDSAQTRPLAARACFDCHSNQTVWPSYGNIAPISWLVQRDVDSGRRKLNYSEWNRPQRDARESAKSVQEGEMPPWYYVPLHPDARLSSTERDALIRGLTATFGAER